MLFWICILILNQLVSGIYIKQEIGMRQFRKQHGWINLGLTYIDQGQAQLSVSLVYFSKKYEPKMYEIEVNLLKEQDFNQQQSDHCSVKPSFQPINLQFQINKATNTAVVNQSKILNVQQHQRVYLVLRDCQSTLINQFFNEESFIQISVSLTLNDSHFTHQHHFDSISLPILMLVCIYLLFQFNYKYKQKTKTSSFGKQIIALTSILLVNQFLSLAQLTTNIVNGQSIQQLTQICCILVYSFQFLAILILFNLSFGWLVTIKNQPFASDLIFKILGLFTWICFSRASYLLSNTITQIVFIQAAIKIILLSVIQFKCYHHIKAGGLKCEFYKKIATLAFFYLIFSATYRGIAQFLDQCRQEQNYLRILLLVNTGYLAAMFKLMFKKGNLFDKVALHNKSFMD